MVVGEIFIRLFLRRYASYLERQWRNSPDAAFFDAVMSFKMRLVIPTVVFAWLLVALLAPTVFQEITRSKVGWLLISAPPAVIVMWWPERGLRSRAEDIETIAQYRPRSERTKTGLLFTFWLLLDLALVPVVGYGSGFFG